MPEQDERTKNAKKKPPSTADILKQIRQKKNLSSSTPSEKPKTIPETKPKKTEPKITQPKLSKPKIQASDKPTLQDEKKKPKKIAEPVSVLDKDSKPAFLEPTTELEAAEPPKSTGGISPRKPRKRFVSAKVISKSAYQKMKNVIFKRSFLHILFLFWMTCIVGYAIMVVIVEFGKREYILENVDKGWIALTEERLDEARTIFGETLEFYKQYRTGFSKYLWFNDGQTEIAVLQMTLGYRNLGEIELGIECFKQVCLHDPFTTNIWMDEKMRDFIFQFIAPQQWSDEELSRMYGLLVQGDPAEWDLGAVYLPLMTEWLAMQLISVQDRFVQSYDVVYGIPIRRNEGNTLTVNAETYYKQEASAGEISIIISSSLDTNANRRLDWYLQQGSQCVIFCQQREGRYILDGIDDIFINDTYFINVFNDIAKTYTYE